jgi:hypothetical protein
MMIRYAVALTLLSLVSCANAEQEAIIDAATRRAEAAASRADKSAKSAEQAATEAQSAAKHALVSELQAGGAASSANDASVRVVK